MSETPSASEPANGPTSALDTEAGAVLAEGHDPKESILLAAESVVAAPTTTGGRLRAGREAAGLAVADIAEVLRFSAHQIEALERDDYARLAGTTLVRGMVRGYAKLLKMQPEPLLVGLETAAKPSLADIRAPSNIGVAEQRTTVGRVSRGVMALIALFVLLFALVAGYVYVMADEPVPRQASSSADTAVLAPAVPAVSVAGTPPSVVASEASGATVAGLDPVQSPPAIPALVLDFDDLSWVEITDASQSIVFRGEHPKGTRRVIDGKPPFQLWIGRASAVRVSYGERVIDLMPHSRDNVARLTVE